MVSLKNKEDEFKVFYFLFLLGFECERIFYDCFKIKVEGVLRWRSRRCKVWFCRLLILLVRVFIVLFGFCGNCVFVWRRLRWIVWEDLEDLGFLWFVFTWLFLLIKVGSGFFRFSIFFGELVFLCLCFIYFYLDLG